MFRARAGSFFGLLLSLAVGCGARTGLVNDSESEFTPVSSAGAGSSAGVGPPPLRTNCQLQGDDPRVAGIEPDELASLDGADFVVGDVNSYHWTLQAEDCDAVVPNAQFTLQDANSRVVRFQPSRPALYHFTLEVTGVAGDRTSCKLAVPVAGVGMRVELCWDTSTTTDLDLYLHTPYDREPWFTRGVFPLEKALNGTTSNTSNSTAILRDQPRVDWGYEDSPLNACNTPAFAGFLGVGRCPNPRAADDNNHIIATGTTERIQFDNPRDGQSFRVMAQNFNYQPARPHVFVYCGGQRAGAFDPPSTPANFVAGNRGGYGVMWRAADITTFVDRSGKVSCSAAPVAERALTIEDSSF